MIESINSQNKLNIELVSVDDWEGLYINGVLILEGHSVSLEYFLEYLKMQGVIQYKSTYLDEADEDELNAFCNRFPDDIKELSYYNYKPFIYEQSH